MLFIMNKYKQMDGNNKSFKAYIKMDIFLISIQFMHKLGCLNTILTIFELSNVVNASKFTVKAKNEINVSYIT